MDEGTNGAVDEVEHEENENHCQSSLDDEKVRSESDDGSQAKAAYKKNRVEKIIVWGVIREEEVEPLMFLRNDVYSVSFQNHEQEKRNAEAIDHEEG